MSPETRPAPLLTVPNWAARLLCGDNEPTHDNALDGLCTAVVENLRAFVHFEPTFRPLMGSGFRMAPVQSGCRQVPAWRPE